MASFVRPVPRVEGRNSKTRVIYLISKENVSNKIIQLQINQSERSVPYSLTKVDQSIVPRHCSINIQY